MVNNDLNGAAPPARLLTKTQLKAERLKPAVNQQPSARYWQGRGWVYQYDASQAVPMKAYRAPSAAQVAALAAGRDLAGTVACPFCATRMDRRLLDGQGCCKACIAAGHAAEIAMQWRSIYRHAAQLLTLDPLFVDTETTGLDADAEVIEVAVVDLNGAVLFESLVKPTVPVPASSTAIHGLTDDDLVDAPAWSHVAPRVAALLQGRVLVAHNSAYDRRLFEQTNARYGLAGLQEKAWECTLELLTPINNDRWPRLAVAMSLAGAAAPTLTGGRPHRAAFDAACCREIVRALAAKHEVSTLVDNR